MSSLKKVSTPLSYFFCLIGLIGLIGCGSTKYKDAGKVGPGYTDQHLFDNTYKVTFKGNRETPKETVENYLLYRAAELTLQNGYDSFALLEMKTETKASPQTMSASVYGLYPNGTAAPMGVPYYASGFPWTTTDARAPASKKHEATAFVRLREGEAPEGKMNIFDAKKVMAALQDKVERP